MEASTLTKMKQLAGISRNQTIRDAGYKILTTERVQESVPYEMQLKNNCKKSSDVIEQEYGKISVEFRHVGEKDSPFLSNNCYRTHLSTATRVASEAAAWQYNRAKHAGHINQ